MAADPEARRRFLELIRSNIASHGNHVTLVQQGATPRFAYTIGLTEHDAPELLLAGAIALSADEAIRTLDHGAEVARQGALGDALDVPGVGTFELRPAHRSWADHMILGALDVYGRETVPALQLVPAAEQRTFDVPDTSRPWAAAREPVWRELLSSDIRVVPLGLLLAYDPSLEPVARLGIGEALQREPPGPWRPWRSG